MADPDVNYSVLIDSDGGLFILGYKVSDNGDGTWHYEYAIQNVNSHQSGQLAGLWLVRILPSSQV